MLHTGAILPLTLHGPYGHLTVEAIVDTGFNGSFTVTPEVIGRLGLRPYGSAFGQNVSRQIMVVNTYLVDIVWRGGVLHCEASEAPIDTCLVGTLLLDRCVLEIDFGAAKSVEVR